MGIVDYPCKADLEFNIFKNGQPPAIRNLAGPHIDKAVKEAMHDPTISTITIIKRNK